MILRIIIDLCFLFGTVFTLAGTLGVIKMPDAFCRMQASTCITTFGVFGIVLGGILYAAFVMHSGATAVKILVIGMLVLCVNPIGCHAIAKGSYRAGICEEHVMKMDDFRRDFNE